MTQGVERWQTIQRALVEIWKAADTGRGCFHYFPGQSVKVEEEKLFEQLAAIGEAHRRATKSWESDKPKDD